MADLTNKLFDIETYRGCHVTSPNMDTLICDNVRGTPLRVKFRKEIDGWQVRVRVDCYMMDKPEPNHAPIMTGQDVNDAIKQFWTKLMDMRYKSDSEDLERRQRRALTIIGGEADPEAPKKRK